MTIRGKRVKGPSLAPGEQSTRAVSKGKGKKKGIVRRFPFVTRALRRGR